MHAAVDVRFPALYQVYRDVDALPPAHVGHVCPLCVRHHYTYGQCVGVQIPLLVVLIGAQYARVQRHRALVVLWQVNIAQADVPVVGVDELHVETVVRVEHAVARLRHAAVFVHPHAVAQRLRSKDEITARRAVLGQSGVYGIAHGAVRQPSVAARQRPLPISAILRGKLSYSLAIDFDGGASGDIYGQVVGRAVGIRRDGDG